MKFQMNFTTSYDDVIRFASAEDLKIFYRTYGCNGLEVMPLPCMDMKAPEKILPPESCRLLTPEMIIGVHCCCIGDWMEKDKDGLLAHYKKDLAYAEKMKAEYVVFHVVQVDEEEGFTYQKKHTDREVIDRAASLINELLDGEEYHFWFLMENLWWPGLTFLHKEDTIALLNQVHYEKKGFMLDTGHFLHTNLNLQTQEEGIAYLLKMLNQQEDMIPYIKGIHLQQSLTGDYVKRWLQENHELPKDPEERFCAIYEHIFQIDKHEPFTADGVKDLISKIDPEYVTYEYITENRKMLEQFLKQGSEALR